MLHIPGLDDAGFDVDNLPGGNGFVDVTEILRSGVAGMSDDDMVFMDGFELQDAMSAFEIGEPRLDTGFELPGDRRPPFQALTPLLPEEICWIIDRSFSCEVEWHTGNSLSQSVYTLLYVHHLQELNEDLFPHALDQDLDPARPLELLTVVMRAAVQGLLKCCDLSWRELSKGVLFDGEDWQGEKFEVSLLEGVPVAYIDNKLQEAMRWLTFSYKITSSPWREPLLLRIGLRQALLQIMHFDVYRDWTGFLSLLDLAQQYVQTIRACPSALPPTDSYAHSAFDPLVARKLATFVPLRVSKLPDMDTTWTKIEGWISGWREATLLSGCPDITTWEIVGKLRQPSSHSPYIRSYTQTLFYNGVFILDKYNSTWLVSKWFSENTGISFEAFEESIMRRWPETDRAGFIRLERMLSKLLLDHVRSHWHNPPRRRRHLMKSLSKLNDLLFLFSEVFVKAGNKESQNSKDDLVNLGSEAAIRWVLSIYRDIILSGFQLGLYAKVEIPFAYWYLSQILEVHLGYLDKVIPHLEEGSELCCELLFQEHVLSALQLLASALYSVTLKLSLGRRAELYHNFARRYKWAVGKRADIPPPDLDAFFYMSKEKISDEYLTPSGCVSLAHGILSRLVESDNAGGWVGSWQVDRFEWVNKIIGACEGLKGLPTTHQQEFDISRLDWDNSVISWFPVVRNTSTI